MVCVNPSISLPTQTQQFIHCSATLQFHLDCLAQNNKLFCAKWEFGYRIQPYTQTHTHTGQYERKEKNGCHCCSIQHSAIHNSERHQPYIGDAQWFNLSSIYCLNKKTWLPIGTACLLLQSFNARWLCWQKVRGEMDDGIGTSNI